MDISIVTGRYPEWNYQESGKALPAELHIAFGEYNAKRGESRT